MNIGRGCDTSHRQLLISILDLEVLSLHRGLFSFLHARSICSECAEALLARLLRLRNISVHLLAVSIYQELLTLDRGIQYLQGARLALPFDTCTAAWGHGWPTREDSVGRRSLMLKVAHRGGSSEV